MKRAYLICMKLTQEQVNSWAGAEIAAKGHQLFSSGAVQGVQANETRPASAYAPKGSDGAEIIVLDERIERGNYRENQQEGKR